MSNDPNVDSTYDGTDPHISFNDAGHMQTTDTVAQTDDELNGGPGLDIGAKIHLRLCSIDDGLKSAQQDASAKEQARLAALPNRLTVNQGTSNPGSAWQLAKYQGPQQGRQWHIRSAVVADVTTPGTALGGAFLCVGAPASMAMVDPVNGFNTVGAAVAIRAVLPITLGAASNTFATGSILVHAGEVVFIVVKPNLAADIIATSLTFEDEPMAASKIRAVAQE